MSRLICKFIKIAIAEQNIAMINDIFDEGYSYDFIEDIEWLELVNKDFANLEG